MGINDHRKFIDRHIIVIQDMSAYDSEHLDINKARLQEMLEDALECGYDLRDEYRESFRLLGIFI
jgi:hypothetical protein